MKAISSEVTVNGHTMPNGNAAIDLDTLIERSVVISSNKQPPTVAFYAPGLMIELRGSAAEEFLSRGEVLTEPGSALQVRSGSDTGSNLDNSAANVSLEEHPANSAAD